VVEPDSSLLDDRRRILAFVALAAAVVAWFVVAPHLGAVSLWPTIVIVSVGVLPGTLLLVYIALPLSRLPWSTLGLAALTLAVVAFGCSQGSGVGFAIAENFAKLWAAVFAGWAFLYLFYDVGLVVLIAAIIPIVDAISVFTPGAPTHEIVKNHISIYNNVAVAFVGPHGATAQLGPPDILFFALFLGAALRFGLRPGWTWLATTGLYAASFPIAIATDANGLPALPFLSLGFLAANGDLLWKAVRKRA
jgi:hypothetical protein